MVPAMTCQDDELVRAQVVSQRAFHRALGGASPGAHVLDLAGGVQATFVPATPRMAIFNSVFYREPDALLAGLEDLAERYASAGIDHWTVWVPPGDRDVARALRAAGHSRRTVPMVVGGRLDELALEPELEIELARGITPVAVARCNDDAFGVPPGTMGRAMGELAGQGTRAHGVARDGAIACGVLVRHDAGNCYPWGLAATSAAQGSIVAIELLRRVLLDAQRAGCTTTTGDVTPAGLTIARYLGMRQLGRWDMWDRRAG